MIMGQVGFLIYFMKGSSFALPGYSTSDGSLAGSTTNSSNCPALPFSLGIMRPYLQLVFSRQY